MAEIVDIQEKSLKAENDQSITKHELQIGNGLQTTTGKTNTRVKKTGRKEICIIITIGLSLMAGLALVAGAIFGISWVSTGVIDRQRIRSMSIVTDLYSSGDSRLHSFSSFFCDAATLNIDNTTSASLHLIDTTPQLAYQDDVSFVYNGELQPKAFRYWQYHLYPNSTIEMLTCSFDYAVDTYLIKGNEDADYWSQYQNSALTEIYRFGSPGRCRRFFHRVPEEDDYYLIVLNRNLSFTATFGTQITIERYEYVPPMMSPSCRAPPGGSCSMNIPYSTSNQDFLVITSIPSNVDWEQGVQVQVNCARRDWAYALVILLPLLIILVLVVSLIVCIVLLCKHKEKCSFCI